MNKAFFSISQFKERIIAIRHKNEKIELAKVIIEHPELFDKLLDLLQNCDRRMSLSGSWVMSEAVERSPDLLIGQYPSLYGLLKKPCHTSMPRNVLRAMAYGNIPDELEGDLFEMCLTTVQINKEAAAVIANSITILQMICRKHPELANEISEILHSRIRYESASFKSRAKGFLKEFPVSH